MKYLLLDVVIGPRCSAKWSRVLYITCQVLYITCRVPYITCRVLYITWARGLLPLLIVEPGPVYHLSGPVYHLGTMTSSSPHIGAGSLEPGPVYHLGTMTSSSPHSGAGSCISPGYDDFLPLLIVEPGPVYHLSGPVYHLGTGTSSSPHSGAGSCISPWSRVPYITWARGLPPLLIVEPGPVYHLDTMTSSSPHMEPGPVYHLSGPVYHLDTMTSSSPHSGARSRISPVGSCISPGHDDFLLSS
ncbi:unnamed protein product [Pleuronectes platessa]|uniref:Uncharacterized protein n=1 Tax=Pleuronectes platessa TaxID=8262 RepID=A0A9N7YTK6_PLEPL|nr:unnamed protein product [Pleuronectes platessa]